MPATRPQVQGKNWSHENGIITFHGRSAGYTETGKWWFSFLVDGEMMTNETMPFGAGAMVEEIIIDDHIQQKDDQIAYVGLPAESALALFLEHRISLKHLRAATELDDGSIFIPNVPFCHKLYSVVISPEEDFSEATYNINNQIV